MQIIKILANFDRFMVCDDFGGVDRQNRKS